MTVAAELLPSVLFAPLAGVVIDRVDRKLLLEVTIALQGTIVALLAALLAIHLLTLAWILLLVFLLNAAAQFPRTTVPALLPRLVTADDLMTANSLYSFSSSSNQLVSLSLGGLVIAAFGVTFPIYYDAATFFVAVLLIAFVAAAYTRRPAPAHGDAPPFAVGRALREGWRFLRSDPVLSELLVFGVTLNVFGGVLLALLAPYAALSLHGSAATYAFLLAFLAAGSIVGAGVLGALPVRHLIGRLLFTGIAGVGAFIALLGLLPSVLPPVAGTFVAGLSTTEGVAFALAVGLGFAIVVANLPLSALFQIRVPDELRGRSLSLLTALLAAPQPLGALLAGTISQAIGLDGLLLLSGIVVIVATGVFLVLLPALRTAAY